MTADVPGKAPGDAPVGGVLIPDICWCWWTRPRASRIGHAVYFGGLDSRGGIVAARLDLTTRAVERSRLAAFEDDDHNNPALLAVENRPLVCFYSRHDAPEGMRYRVSQGALNIAEWGPEHTLAFGGSTTYAEVHVVGERIHLFTRVDETRWSWRASDDWSASWDAPRDLLAFTTDQQVYMATVLAPDGRTLRLAVSGHPKDYEKMPLHDVWACRVDLVSGAVTLASSDKVIGNLLTGEGLPLDYGALELVHQVPRDRTTNVLDVGSGDTFEIGYVTKLRDDLTTRDARYHVASLRDGRWVVEDIVAAGAKFGYIDAGFYVGGLAFAPRGDGLYLTREAGGLWHFEHWRREAGRWAATPLRTPASTRLARPWALDDPVADLAAVALAVERYDDDSYFGSRSHLIGGAP
jgi:hypothetical protein